MDRSKILIADDDSRFIQRCIEVLVAKASDYEMLAIESVQGCIDILVKNKFDIVLLDINFTLNGREGIKLIHSIQSHSPKASIIMLTSVDDEKTVAECMSLGAIDFISKNKCDAPSIIANRIDKISAKRTREFECNFEAEAIARSVGAVFCSDAMNVVFKEAAIAKKHRHLHALVQGPSGSGKELVARAIAGASQGTKFIALNCACLSDTLFESELFGHEKGSFTGAIKTKMGRFEEAGDGAIFLDEVARLSPAAQGKLLRVLQDGFYYRVGGSEMLQAKARIIAATNENLEQMVDKGEFREDLLHRLKKIVVSIPPLSNRKDDIVPIMEQFLKRSPLQNITIASDLAAYLQGYSWPGNVRELENTVNHMLTRVEDGTCLTIGDLPRQFFEKNKSINLEDIDPTKNFQFEIEETSSDPAKIVFDNFERQYIKWAANRLNEPLTIRSLASELRISKSAMQRKLQALGIKFVSTIKGGMISE